MDSGCSEKFDPYCHHNLKEPMSSGNYENTLIVHSTIATSDDNVAVNGSWFVRVLSVVFMRQACKKHLTDLLATVDTNLKRLQNQKFSANYKGRPAGIQ
jgi:hypothetical protein